MEKDKLITVSPKSSYFQKLLDEAGPAEVCKGRFIWYEEEWEWEEIPGTKRPEK